MDSQPEKYGYKNYRMTGNQYYRKGENTVRNDRKYRWSINRNSRSRKQHFKSINDFSSRRNFRHLPRRSTVNESSRGTYQSVEEAEEEERRKKLTTTANNLLSKIKTWRAENQTDETKNQATENTSSFNPENSKPKRIAHTLTKPTAAQKRTAKTSTKPRKNSKRAKYDVNKATVKDFQNRIRHKLINEIMQMPKENLQNVLNDPKINPIMEVKMSRLVRENKLLICQKLRTLAESKMTSNGSSDLLGDIDQLIDPVIETDLSVLPYELIKKMENIFQVQFDYTYCGTDTESGVKTVYSIPFGETFTTESTEFKSSVQNVDCGSFGEAVTTECSEFESIPSNSTENLDALGNIGGRTESRSLSDDLRLYECSTDEDEDEDLGTENETKYLSEDSRNLISCQSESLEQLDTSDKPRRISLEVTGEEEQETPEENLPSVGLLTVKNFTKSNHSSNSEQCVRASSNSESKSTQTSVPLQLLYGAPLPKQSYSNNPAELLEEVESIQSLINKLNERRFMIFLELAKTDPGGSFTKSQSSCQNFVETVSNGSMCLVESLMKFFYKQGK